MNKKERYNYSQEIMWAEYQLQQNGSVQTPWPEDFFDDLHNRVISELELSNFEDRMDILSEKGAC